MRTVTLRQDVYHGLLTQLQDQQAELREWRGIAKPDKGIEGTVHALRLFAGMTGQCAGMIACMIHTPGRVYAFSELIDAAAPYGAQHSKRLIDADVLCKTRMAQARKALELVGHGDAITTLRGAGYVMPAPAASTLKAWIATQQAAS